MKTLMIFILKRKRVLFILYKHNDVVVAISFQKKNMKEDIEHAIIFLKERIVRPKSCVE